MQTAMLKYKAATTSAGYRQLEQAMLHMGLLYNAAIRHRESATGWQIPPVRNNDHPAPFPPELGRRCIESSPDNGPVLDPFLGSGTTALAAQELRRDSIGIERSGKFCNDARASLEEARRLHGL
ncbi:MAG: site-specific DNA-methyltransferase [Chloroflexota bacterium]|nr:site-specific DNA-methyltransferase [Chloroflexota bacterium]